MLLQQEFRKAKGSIHPNGNSIIGVILAGGVSHVCAPESMRSLTYVGQPMMRKGRLDFILLRRQHQNIGIVLERHVGGGHNTIDDNRSRRRKGGIETLALHRPDLLHNCHFFSLFFVILGHHDQCITHLQEGCWNGTCDGNALSLSKDQVSAGNLQELFLVLGRFDLEIRSDLVGTVVTKSIDAFVGTLCVDQDLVLDTQTLHFQ
mmetsp:Transcript_23313/g.54144  ORF Transcript_23313/g.54144 Transcript_23313/m.54144 type:complete len:205 (-) Transcript_23313:798-1412(-)